MNSDEPETQVLRSTVTPDTWASLEELVSATCEDDTAEIRMAVLELQGPAGDNLTLEGGNAVVRRAILHALVRAAPAVAARKARRTPD